MTVESSQAILIVEDDGNLAEMLTAYCRAQGFRAHAVALGSEGVAVAASDLPDLIILDIHLPDIDGYEVCQRLRQSHKTRGIPILFLTEMNTRADVLHGLEMGVVDYITKPFDPEELLLRARNVLRRAASVGVEHPVTGLPEGAAVDEALAQIAAEGHDRALVVVALLGLDSFREMYGFVASDDVLRMVAQTLNRASLEAGGGESFVGHVDECVFLAILPPDQVAPFESRVEQRLANTLDYYYPGDNRGPNALTTDRLRLWRGAITADDATGGVEALRERLAAHPAFMSPQLGRQR